MSEPILRSIVRQMIRYQRDHGGERPKEHWIDEATWKKLCLEYQTRPPLPCVKIMDVPVKVWDV